MIWFPFFFLMLCIQGSFSYSVETCSVRLRNECDYSQVPQRFPETKAELINACDSIKSLVVCVLQVKGTCPDEGEIHVEHYRKIKEFIDDACEEDSDIFQVISDNIQCVADTGRTVGDQCRFERFSPKQRNYIIQGVKALIDSNNSMSEEDERCIMDFSRIACLSSKFGVDCGDATRDAAFEILANVHSNYGLCREETRKELETLKDDIEMVIRDEQNLSADIEEK